MIIRKSELEINIMKEAGRIVASTHQLMKQNIAPGVTTKQLDKIAEDYILSQGATPSFKGYNGFPASICASVNEQLVHGFPNDTKLQEGDIVSIDIGAKYKGYHGDSAWTYPVGSVSDEVSKLLKVTEDSLYAGIAEIKPDVRLYTLSHAIQQCIEENGLSVVREYVGHGIGADLHEEPQIPNYGLPDRGPRLKPGMVLAIEPMVVQGQRFVKTLSDNWTVVSVDGSMCAHFEHTVAITDDGYDILTKL
ncbi:type I methionyl aminopeptidase [Longirhabdus pacifica]|uniref:type I methionyl aminopeptidase n=1 Tax=Longirhabdus pacifica TaxID=2305227 RepID=UPI001008BFA0|nr:type I methionyl aminopeptidase [Longirhabdus pacifica]